MAARLGDVPACRALVSIGANIDSEGHPDGNPLDLGIIFNRLEVVEYLVRAGASIVYYSTHEGRYKSAFGRVH
jgi:ankyrin repeat protein